MNISLNCFLCVFLLLVTPVISSESNDDILKTDPELAQMWRDMRILEDYENDDPNINFKDLDSTENLSDSNTKTSYSPHKEKVFRKTKSSDSTFIVLEIIVPVSIFLVLICFLIIHIHRFQKELYQLESLVKTSNDIQFYV